MFINTYVLASFSLFHMRFEDESQLIKDKRKHHGVMDNRSSEQRFLYIQRDYIVPLLCEKTGALAIVEPGLTAVWQARRPLGR